MGAGLAVLPVPMGVDAEEDGAPLEACVDDAPESSDPFPELVVLLLLEESSEPELVTLSRK